MNGNVGTVKPHQKVRRYAKRQLIKLPAHRRLTPFDKLMKKKGFKKRFESSNDK